MAERLDIQITGTNRSQRAFAQLNRQFEETRKRSLALRGTLGRVFLPAAGLAGFTSALRRATDAMAEFDRIGKRARTAGLTSDFYQVLGVAANEASVSQGVLNSSLIAFTKRIGEARAGVGPLASTLKRIDAGLFEALKNTRNQEEALRVLADAYRQADTATQRAALSAAAFSRTGVEFGRILAQGAAGLDATGVKARKLGLIIDSDLIQRAETLQNSYGLATQRIDVEFKSLMVQLAPAIAGVTNAIAGNIGALRELAGPVARLKREYQPLLDVLGKIDNFTARFTPLFNPTGSLRLVAGQLRAARLAAGEPGASISGPQSVASGGKTDFGISATGFVPKPRARPQGLSTSTVTATRTATRSMRDYNTSLRENLSTARATASANNTLADTLANGMTSSLSDVIRGTKSLSAAFRDMSTTIISDLVRMNTNALVRGFFSGGFGAARSGPINLLSGLGGVPRFAGAFAGGGRIPAGSFGLVGERGPELVSGPANVTPAGQGGVSIQIVNQTGAQIAAQQSRGPGGRINLKLAMKAVARETMVEELPQMLRAGFGINPKVIKR